MRLIIERKITETGHEPHNVLVMVSVSENVGDIMSLQDVFVEVCVSKESVW